MGDDAKPWDICDDCLDPFAKKLLAFVKRFRPVFDQAEAIRLETQGQQPPRPDDLRELCYEFDVDRAVVQLQATFSLDFANEFVRKLRSVVERFRTLDSKANQRLDRYVGKYATPLLIGWYFIAVEKLPTGDELPHDLRKIKAEIVEEYMNVRNEFELVSKYLSNVSTEVRRKSMPIPVAATMPKARVVPIKPKREKKTDKKQTQMISCFTAYHRQYNGLNSKPIGLRELARLARVSPSTAWSFFEKEYGGYAKYEEVCDYELAKSLKRMNQEYAPRISYGGAPPDNGKRDREDEDQK